MKKIPLTQGQFALVDDSDFEWLSQWKWCAQWNSSVRGFYAKRRARNSENRKTDTVLMHSEITGCIKTDHRNGNTLDNQRHNLRSASTSQNAANSRFNCANKSGMRGVYWDKERNRWHAQTHFGGKRIFLGRFSDLKSAGEAYNKAAKKLFGEFAQLNPT